MFLRIPILALSLLAQVAPAASEMLMKEERINILGTPLEVCSSSPLTGFQRDGFCAACASDSGNHTVCAIVTQSFLDYTQSRGNDLQTPRPEFGFSGLKAGDKWCLCAGRFYEAHKAGHAPNIDANATAREATNEVPQEILLSYAKKTK